MSPGKTFLLAVAASLAFAGCVQPATDLPTSQSHGDPVAPPTGETAKPGILQTTGPDPNGTIDGCKKQNAGMRADCVFKDDQYHEYVLYEVDTAQVDVLIVPAAAPDPLGRTAIAKNAVQAWADGAAALGVDWFRSGFNISVYVLGQDVPPAQAVQDPEIVVFAAEYNPALLFGIGAEPKQAFVCELLGQSALRTYAAHRHDGLEVQASDCTGTGFTCLAINTSFALVETLQGDGEKGEVWMQDLVAHEFGHCLGLGHVGDALDFAAQAVPLQDIMSYEHDKAQVHCVSNLNVRVLEDVYAGVLGHPEADLLQAGDYYAMDPADYRHIVCPNP